MYEVSRTLALKIHDVVRSPFFVVGLLIRLALIFLFTPAAAMQWYAPFVDTVLRQPSLDPWTTFLASGGDLRAFPYGTAMVLALTPMHALVGWLSPASAYLLSLLVFDVLLLVVLRGLFTDAQTRRLLLLYWLSPIIIFATYWMGLNDLVPVTMLFLAIWALERRRPAVAGVLTAAAISCKVSMILAWPILVIYLMHNKPLRRYLPTYAMWAVGFLVALMLPQMVSEGGRQMLFGNPELAKVYDLSIAYSEQASIYMLPVAYLVTLYWIWRFKRLRFDLLISALAISFLLVLMLTPAAPGWFVWVLPCLVWFQLKSDRVSFALVLALSALYVVQTALTSPLAAPTFIDGHPLAVFGHEPVGHHAASLLQTILTAVTLVMAVRLFRQGVQLNEFYRLSRKPLVVGIAGDSGAGKDTLVLALEGLLGRHSTTRLSGDDYHLWDRHRPIWQAMTHLNPRANDLSQFATDVARIAAGRPISLRHYDHERGRSGKPQRLPSNDFVIVSGLHALFLPALREHYDLSIYLDTDDELRRWFKLRRDVQVRGHDPDRVLDSMARREADAQHFVRPQKAAADVILAIRAHRPLPLTVKSIGASPRLMLAVRSRHSAPYEELGRLLVSFAGVGVESSISEAGGISLLIDGDIGATEVAYVAGLMLPQLRDLLDLEPRWEAGVLGLMQLIVLLEASIVLRKRSI
jgi:uridine kinase